MPSKQQVTIGVIGALVVALISYELYKHFNHPSRQHGGRHMDSDVTTMAAIVSD